MIYFYTSEVPNLVLILSDVLNFKNFNLLLCNKASRNWQNAMGPILQDFIPVHSSHL